MLKPLQRFGVHSICHPQGESDFHMEQLHHACDTI
jgi:hypothetical protein